MLGTEGATPADVVVTRLKDQRTALGVALYFLGRREPFGSLPARDLVNTVARHMHTATYLMAFEDTQMTGYFGWEMFGEAAAERFRRTGVAPPPEEATGGEVVWLTAVAADSRAALSALVGALRGLNPGRRVLGVRHKPGLRPFVFAGRFGPRQG